MLTWHLTLGNFDISAAMDHRLTSAIRSPSDELVTGPESSRIPSSWVLTRFHKLSQGSGDDDPEDD